MAYLRDFLYLDNAKLHSFVSQIQGGMISEISETIKQLGGLSAGINVGIPPLGGKVDASNQKESERQQNIILTDPTLADAILDRLVHNAQRIELKGESQRKLRADRSMPNT